MYRVPRNENNTGRRKRQSKQGDNARNPPVAIEAFIATITGAITSVVASATSNAPPARVNANAKKISSVIDPY